MKGDPYNTNTRVHAQRNKKYILRGRTVMRKPQGDSPDTYLHGSVDPDLTPRRAVLGTELELSLAWV